MFHPRCRVHLSCRTSTIAMFARPLITPTACGSLLTLLIATSGCASTSGARHGSDREGHDALLKLEVTPATAEVYIDGAYSGQISRWRDQSVPVHSGSRRIELRAPEHITERFDVHIGASELVTLRVALEPELDLLEEEEAQEPSSRTEPSTRSSTHRLLPDPGIQP